MNVRIQLSQGSSLRRAATRFVVTVAIVIAALAMLAFLIWEKNRTEPYVVSGFIEADQMRVGSRVGGRVSEVMVEEGSRLKAGDVLYRIDPFDLQKRLAEAEAELAKADAEYQRMKAGYRPEEIAQAGAKRAQAAATLDKIKAGPRKQENEMARSKLDPSTANLALGEAG